MKKVVVETLHGKVIGKEDNHGVISFKGIPYAKPPVGSLRWRPPVEPDRADKEIEAFYYGYTCVQPIDEVEPASVSPQGEDCLTLNIWAKETGEHNKPVMVFIHGGGFIGGGTTDPLYDGENFVTRRNDVVLVTINYRLNVFGFLNLEEIGGKAFADSGNLGILDQIQALKWIKANIQYFGGDPENITIFGESAGGASVSLLMTIPEAMGLFQKVIAESGCVNITMTPEMSKQVAKTFLKTVGKNTIAELLHLSADELREAYIKLCEYYGDYAESIFCPIRNSGLILKDPYTAIKNGCAEGVKLMIGTAKDEWQYWRQYINDFDNQYYKHLVESSYILGFEFNKNIETIDRYLNLYKEDPGIDRYLELGNDITFREAAILTAQYQSKYADTYMYYFTWPSKVKGLGACHAVELPFVFHNLDSESGLAFTGENPPGRLADMVQDAWVNFAKTGRPAVNNDITWPRYDSRNRATMFIDKQWKVVNDPRSKERVLLKNIYESPLVFMPVDNLSSATRVD